MKSKNLLILVLIVVGVLICLGSGYLFGATIEKKRTESQIESLEKLADITSTLSSSKLINSIVAFGKVTNISGRTITLTAETENLKINIRQSAQIYSFVEPVFVGSKVSGVPAQSTAGFKDIKIGDNLNINMKMLPDGQLEGLSVVILSPAMKISQ